MGLFDHILAAIDNPGQEANPDQLDGILNLAQQLASNYGVNPAITQTALSIVGNFVRSTLQEKRATGGQDQVQALVNQYSGFLPNAQAVQALFTPGQQQQVVQETARRTGLNPDTVQSMLPALVPLVLNLLKSGADTQNPQGKSNPVLSAFLDADGSGSVDVGDALSMAGRFLSQRR